MRVQLLQLQRKHCGEINEYMQHAGTNITNTWTVNQIKTNEIYWLLCEKPVNKEGTHTFVSTLRQLCIASSHTPLHIEQI